MNTSTTSGAMYSAEPHWDGTEERRPSAMVALCTESGGRWGWGGAGRRGYRCGELRRRDGGAGAAQLHSAAQVEVTDLHWRHLGEGGGALVMTSHSQVLLELHEWLKSLTLSVYSQRMFSSFRSLWAIPARGQSTGAASGHRDNPAVHSGTGTGHAYPLCAGSPTPARCP